MATTKGGKNGKRRQPASVESSPFENDLASAFGDDDGPVCIAETDDALIGRFVKLICESRGYCGFGSRPDSSHVSLSIRLGSFSKSLTILDNRQFEGVVSTVHKAIRKSKGG